MILPRTAIPLISGSVNASITQEDGTLVSFSPYYFNLIKHQIVLILPPKYFPDLLFTTLTATATSLNQVSFIRCLFSFNNLHLSGPIHIKMVFLKCKSYPMIHSPIISSYCFQEKCKLFLHMFCTELHDHVQLISPVFLC